MNSELDLTVLATITGVPAQSIGDQYRGLKADAVVAECGEGGDEFCGGDGIW